MTELTYSSYLHLDQLLELQEPRSEPPEHDEYLFIIIHQTYELWFKLLLIELDKVKADFSAGDLYGSLATLKRCRTIMKTLVGQLDILETMTPTSFASFRDRLETASGFQSAQFREFEFLLGIKRPNLIGHLAPGSPARRAVQRRLAERSLIDHFYDFLATRGVEIPSDLVERDVTQSNSPHEAIERAVLDLYRTAPDLVLLFELMTDLDEGLQEWRYRHVKVAERAIGDKKGTGGSTGVEFLKAALFKPIFPELWAIRRHL